MAAKEFSGIWHSHYRYPSTSRNADFVDDHLVRVHQYERQIIIESLPEQKQKSYLMLHLTLQGGVATGTWQEETEQHGYYKGAVYYGAIQVVIDKDKKHMQGKWLGFGKDMEVEVGPWDFTYVGEDVPAEVA